MIQKILNSETGHGYMIETVTKSGEVKTAPVNMHNTNMRVRSKYPAQMQGSTGTMIPITLEEYEELKAQYTGTK